MARQPRAPAKKKDDFEVRAYRKGDQSEVIALWRRCGLVYPWNDPETDLALAVASKQTAIYLASRRDRLVGSVMVGHDGHRGWLYYLGIDPKARGRGIARKLVRRAETWLIRRKVPKVQLMIRETNLDAGSFYARIGYHPNPCRVMQRWLAKDRGAPEAPGAEHGKLGLTITYLEMTSRPRLGPPPRPMGTPLALMRAVDPSVAFYRFLYNQVGETWLWWQRRALSDEELAAIIGDDRVEIYVLYVDGVPAGFAELDRRGEPDIDLAYMGLMPSFVGRKLGPYLLHAAIDTAWSHNPHRLTVNTCDLDHPKALALYQRFGFRAYDQKKVEWTDPRRSGVLDFTGV